VAVTHHPVDKPVSSERTHPAETETNPEAASPIPAETTSNAVIELYKLYVESMEKAVARRQTMHSFFLAANTLLLSLAGLLVTKDFVRSGVSAVPIMLASIAGAMLSLVWMKLSRHYGLLNTGKFRVIHALESKLPVKPFHEEWKELGEGRDPRRYQSMAAIERLIPVVFLILFTILFVVGLVAFLSFFR
jgi:hypothetical protein